MFFAQGRRRGKHRYKRDVIASMDEGCWREQCAYLAVELLFHSHHDQISMEKKIIECGIAGGHPRQLTESHVGCPATVSHWLV